MVAPAVGVLSVRCPVCRVAPGRECRTRRGWLTSHHQRRAAWLAEERAEVRDLHERAGETAAATSA